MITIKQIFSSKIERKKGGENLANVITMCKRPDSQISTKIDEC
jgi:hypothetical protein